MKRTPRSQLYVGYGADSGPSRGEARRRTSRPSEAYKAAICNGRFTSTPAIPFTQMAVIHRVIEIWARGLLNRARPITGHVLD